MSYLTDFKYSKDWRSLFYIETTNPENFFLVYELP